MRLIECEKSLLDSLVYYLFSSLLIIDPLYIWTVYELSILVSRKINFLIFPLFYYSKKFIITLIMISFSSSFDSADSRVIAINELSEIIFLLFWTINYTIYELKTAGYLKEFQNTLDFQTQN